jgi:PAS domain-containing protein
MLGRDNTQHTGHGERAPLVEQEFRATAERIPALAARRRADRTIDFVNRTSWNSDGLSQQSCKGRWIQIVHPDDRAQVEDAWPTHLVGSGGWL